MATGYELFLQQGGKTDAEVAAWEAANPGKNYYQTTGALTWAEWHRNARLGVPGRADDPTVVQNTRGNTVTVDNQGNWVQSNNQLTDFSTTNQPQTPTTPYTPGTTKPPTVPTTPTTPTTPTAGGAGGAVAGALPPALTGAGGQGNVGQQPGTTPSTPTTGTQPTVRPTGQQPDWTPGQNVDPGQIGHGSLGGAVSYGTINRGVAAGNRAYQNLTDPVLPDAAILRATQSQIGSDEIADPTDPRFQISSAGLPQQAATGAAAQVDPAQGINAAQVEAALVGQGAAGTEAAAQGTQDPSTLAAAALGNLPPEAMVQSQMEELLTGLENDEVPDWAKPAVDAVEAQLAARGLTRSSVGQAALSNAIIQAAMPMAQQNAQAITANFSQNLQNQQQVNLQNAQAGQQLQLTNLNNQQQIAIANLNARQQAMLSDQASQNAAAQFNATSQNQVNQFMTNLQATIDQQNAQRTDAMTQFNAGQQNAMRQFNANLQFNSDKFNAENATVISQSNLQWRRQVNLANTAIQNQVNQINAQNAYNLSNEALDRMWQEMRDVSEWAFQNSINDKKLASALAVASLQASAQKDAGNTQAWANIGAFAFNAVSDNWGTISGWFS